MAYDTRELFARLIQCEAGGEGEDGMRAVATVIMNRATIEYGEFARVSEGGNIRKIITVSLTPTEESTGTGLCNQPVMEGISFNGQEIINSQNLDVVVYNTTGQLVASSNKNINLSAYPAGVYVIKAANGASMKIVK